MPPRVVLDTNIVLSALLFARGRLVPLRLAWHRGLFVPLANKITAAELIRVLAYPKFKLSADDQRELLGDYLPWCTTVRMPAKAPITPKIRDPHDQPFLELALAGKADYLVTGDADLHAIDEPFAVPIITAEAFLGLLPTE
ncbi:MAG: putative toxin-antitoxin system toxin component, PIN family [Xanthomonadales bacterium]|nr:putative toxin-antitoxin system toxin component, PIN family [Xanthomonadales bacterium]MCB1610493.1 putative toxin-antitoxin system toxin component, PIN family [Xanthomonadales bacterium]